MLGSRKQFAMNLVIIFIESFLGLLANLIPSILLQDYSYLYGALLGIVFVLIWILYYFLFYWKLILNGTKPSLINQDKIQLWLFFGLRRLLIIVPFIVTIIVFIFAKSTFNAFSLISIHLGFLLSILIYNIILVIVNSEKRDGGWAW